MYGQPDTVTICEVSVMSQQATYSTEISDNDLTVTAAARSKLVELIADADDGEIEGVRIFVSGGGCGGMTYGMTFTGQSGGYDKILNDDSLTVFVDTVALNYLRGAEIDFVEREMGASFVFNNVFASVGGSGGCSACGSGGGGCA